MNLVVVVMGVSGSGKTTIGQALADRLGVPYAEADNFHPAANVAKMAAGHPLTDEDREPWLRSIAAWISERAGTGGGVVTCSALKRRYRDLLRTAAQTVWFLHLDGGRELIGARIAVRTSHFMPASLLDTQFADLEPLGADEPGLAVDVAGTPEEIVDVTVRVIQGVLFK